MASKDEKRKGSEEKQMKTRMLMLMSVVLAGTTSLVSAKNAGQRPNFLLVVADEVGVAETGAR